ncbi:hypothetical protein KP509_05G044200 [Ceratopteris richardii]|uniref:NAD(P)H-quinone oxidoreductase subunit 6, chloroplastic n=2 Tax=Ceratopteris richardii TaxID=49495 RepID=A0A8T2USS1_CERRI|nr:hypothetical protein KP509_05G044200 [Ceratopteris richardii]
MNLSELIHEFILALIEPGILVGSIGTISFINTTNSSFSLGLVFTCISLLYFALNADFIAAAQLLVYVGAINVLIVFAIMITDQSVSSDSEKRGIGYFTALGACSILFLTIVCIFHKINDFYSSSIHQSEYLKLNLFEQNDVQNIGYQLLNKFLVPFELASLLLLVALVGAINPARDEDEGKDIAENKKKSFVSSTSPRDKSSFF